MIDELDELLAIVRPVAQEGGELNRPQILVLYETLGRVRAVLAEAQQEVTVRGVLEAGCGLDLYKAPGGGLGVHHSPDGKRLMLNGYWASIDDCLAALKAFIGKKEE